MSASPAPAYASGTDAEEDGMGPSVVVVESDSAWHCYRGQKYGGVGVKE